MIENSGGGVFVNDTATKIGAVSIEIQPQTGGGNNQNIADKRFVSSGNFTVGYVRDSFKFGVTGEELFLMGASNHFFLTKNILSGNLIEHKKREYRIYVVDPDNFMIEVTAKEQSGNDWITTGTNSTKKSKFATSYAYGGMSYGFTAKIADGAITFEFKKDGRTKTVKLSPGKKICGMREKDFFRRSYTNDLITASFKVVDYGDPCPQNHITVLGWN